MKAPTWLRKEAPADDRGPLKGAALARLGAMDHGTLVQWMDNSLTRIGTLLHDSARPQPGAVAMLEDALQETLALEQALRELLGRVDRP